MLQPTELHQPGQDSLSLTRMPHISWSAKAGNSTYMQSINPLSPSSYSPIHPTSTPTLCTYFLGVFCGSTARNSALVYVRVFSYVSLKRRILLLFVYLYDSFHLLPMLQKVIKVSALLVLRIVIKLFSFVLYCFFNWFLVKREDKHYTQNTFLNQTSIITPLKNLLS